MSRCMQHTGGNGHSLVGRRAGTVIRRILGQVGARRYKVKAAVRGVRHCAMRTRLLHVAAIVALGCGRNVNPRSDQLMLKRLSLSKAADWGCSDSGHRNRTKAKCAPSIHKSLLVVLF